ncbi:26S proteasome non-ATPase regulatory subunit 4 [Zea mays]|uniref:26S proteasome non-ATPase regulatory subunit 4 homolog n=1 Tax=Zea mays TaxID=4577 RepID=A0A317YLK3_MAIZE|nr:26S proteasome non-ATPase regulatory subunit 4 [Zea mays]
MVLEATMICVDNSEWMRNGDYPPSRFAAQAHAFAVLSGAKTEANLESTVGLVAMAGKGVSVLVPPTNDFGKVLSGMNGLEIGGEANLTAAIQVAQFALKNRQNKQLRQRIIVFVGSPVIDEKNWLEVIGKNLKKNNVALDVVNFGESDNEKPEKLEALVAAVNSGGNSHIIHIPAGRDLSDALFSSPIILSEDRGSDSAAAARGASGFEFDVDPNVDPELALVLLISMEEERLRQEAAAKKAREESSKTENEGQSSTSNGDIVMADAEPEPNSYTEDKGLHCKIGKERQVSFNGFRYLKYLLNILVMDEGQLLEKARKIRIEDYISFEELFDGVTSDTMSAFQEEETCTQSDAGKDFGHQPFEPSVRPGT